MLWVPIEHGTLLRIPAPRLIDHPHRVIRPRIEQTHVRRIVRPWQPVLKTHLQCQDITAVRVPRNRPALADVTEIMMLQAVGDLGDADAGLSLRRTGRADGNREKT